MFVFLRSIVHWSRHVFTTVIAVLDVVDTLVCDWEGIQKTGVNDGNIFPPTSKIWTLLSTFGNCMCHAYTFNGVGISYAVAREVSSMREQFRILQEQYPETDLAQLYTVYTKTHCLTNDDDVYFKPMFHKLTKIRCTDVARLTVQRTYMHPVFGLRYGDTTLSELELDAKITIFDIGGILAHVFDIDEEKMTLWKQWISPYPRTSRMPSLCSHRQ